MSRAQHAEAFIAFLHCEAKNNEERAKNLRATANAIEGKSHARIRKRDDVKKKKAHSAYSLFVQENIEQFKKSHPDVPAEEIASVMSRQWTCTSEEEKKIWKFRAEQMDIESSASYHEALNQGDETDDESINSIAGKKRAALKKLPKSGQSTEV